MSEMDHWHPVLDSGRLRQSPQPIVLNGRQIALFRTSGGKIGALDDCCPHRRMRLSAGQVVGERLQCTYHGWTYDCQGAGESPGTPKLHACAVHYDTREHYGWIWLKAAGATAEFPQFDVDGYRFVGTLQERAGVPLEVVLDNFTEVEHTPTTHALLGYELAHMSQVVTEVESDDASVRVFNAGPQKHLPAPTEFLFGINTGDRFVDDWTTRFSPVYTVYDQYWSDAKTNQERGVRWRIYVFFNPIDAEHTDLVIFSFIKPPADGGWRNWFLFKPSLMWFVRREVRLDMEMLEKLADKRPGIQGMKLSRFDKVLGLHRERIERIYRNGHRDVLETPAKHADG